MRGVVRKAKGSRKNKGRPSDRVPRRGRSRDPDEREPRLAFSDSILLAGFATLASPAKNSFAADCSRRSPFVHGGLFPPPERRNKYLRRPSHDAFTARRRLFSEWGFSSSWNICGTESSAAGATWTAGGGGSGRLDHGHYRVGWTGIVAASSGSGAANNSGEKKAKENGSFLLSKFGACTMLGREALGELDSASSFLMVHTVERPAERVGTRRSELDHNV
ncbi:hypothetical protein ACHAWF_011753 [Thalassiosira exigua]